MLEIRREKIGLPFLKTTYFIGHFPAVSLGNLADHNRFGWPNAETGRKMANGQLLTELLGTKIEEIRKFVSTSQLFSP